LGQADGASCAPNVPTELLQLGAKFPGCRHALLSRKWGLTYRVYWGLFFKIAPC
jgi:hypothetical protein